MITRVRIEASGPDEETLRRELRDAAHRLIVEGYGTVGVEDYVPVEGPPGHGVRGVLVVHLAAS